MHANDKNTTFATQNRRTNADKQTYNSGEMAEWSIAAVLKTVEGHTSGGSNPSLSAKINEGPKFWGLR